MGCGLYVELIEHETLLEIVETSDTTTSILIGELTVSEEKAIDNVVKLGLGVGIKKVPDVPKLSAGVGSVQGLPRVEQELSATLHKPTAAVKTSIGVKSKLTEKSSETPPRPHTTTHGEDHQIILLP